MHLKVALHVLPLDQFWQGMFSAAAISPAFSRNSGGTKSSSIWRKSPLPSGWQHAFSLSVAN
jgi:hypothetical protein